MASEAKLDSIWVPKELLPASGTIIGFEELTETTKRGVYTYYRLNVDFKPGIYQMDVKYGNKNFLINTISSDPQKWIGQRIGVRLDENGYRQVFND